MAQYETGARTPKADLTNALANALDVSPKALDVPDIDSYTGLMHTLFALEDIYGLKIGEIDGEVCLRLDKSKKMTYVEMLDMFMAWNDQAQKLAQGEITKDEYDRWRYRYPEFDNTQCRANVPSQEVGEMFIDDLKDKTEND